MMEHFYTIQGEGYHQGRAAYFIRLAGCDVGCVWCDVKESWHTEGYPVVPVEEMAAYAADAGSPIAVITGGEPLMYPLDALTNAIHAKGLRTHIETSGAYPLSGNWDWICLSPKKFKAALPENLPHANELKIIVYNKSDFKWAEEYAAQVNSACKLYLQPEWSVESKMLPQIIDYVKAHPKWEVSLQIHKYMQIP